jgi:hypothetical protein
MSEKVKLLRVPARFQNREMMINTISQLENTKTIVVLVEDDEGVWTMFEEGATLERINWMLDRAKVMLHD